MPNKFTLNKNEVIYSNGIPLYRIQALRAFGDVQEHEAGGYLASEDNLAQDCNCWVYPDSYIASTNVRVSGNARIFNSKLTDYAKVTDDAVATGSSLAGSATVCGQALVRFSTVTGTAHIGDSVQALGLNLYGEMYLHADCTVTKQPLYIAGGKFLSLTFYGDYLSIGGETTTIQMWLDLMDKPNFNIFGKSKDIYKNIITFVNNLNKQHGDIL